MLVDARWFQRRELAVEQAGRHEMPFAVAHPVADQLPIPFEIDQPDVAAIADQDLAIGLLERRAGDDDGLTLGATARDFVGDRLQPGPAIRVGEGLARAHLGDIGRRVETVAILEAPAEAPAERLPDRALS